jgi:hypothetical protein
MKIEPLPSTRPFHVERHCRGVGVPDPLAEVEVSMTRNLRFTVLVWVCLRAILGLVQASDTSGTQLGSVTSGGSRWQSVVLWTNETLSATLYYMPEASLADEDYMFVELNNQTGTTLNVQQAWLSLPGTRVNLATKASAFMGDMTGGVIYNGKSPPGRTNANQRGVFECGLANLGLPPREGFQVDLVAKADVRLWDGSSFSTPGGEVRFPVALPEPGGAGVHEPAL